MAAGAGLVLTGAAIVITGSPSDVRALVGFAMVWGGLGAMLRGSLIMRWGGSFLLACVAFMVIVSATMTDLVTAPRQLAPAGESSTRISMQHYLQIHDGMTYNDVVRLLGDRGTEISRVDLSGYRTVMFQWQGDGLGNMTATFQNEKLVSKAQFGLR